MGRFGSGGCQFISKYGGGKACFQYKAELLEAYEQQITQAMTEEITKKNVPVINGKKQ